MGYASMLNVYKEKIKRFKSQIKKFELENQKFQSKIFELSKKIEAEPDRNILSKVKENAKGTTLSLRILAITVEGVQT